MPFDFYYSQRRKILKQLIILASVLIPVASILNAINGLYLLAIIELVFSAISIWVVIRFDQLVTVDTVSCYSFILSNALLMLLMYVLLCKEETLFEYMWVITIPFSCYLLNGLKKGTLLTSVYAGLSILIFSYKHHLNWSEVPLDAVFHVIGSIICVWTLAFLYARASSNDKYQLKELAMKDPLTKLNNRNVFYEFFEKQRSKTLSLMIIDLDWFKDINDTYGHDAGDYVLIEFAKILHLVRPDNAQVFRMGGEEFAMLLPNYDSHRSLVVAKQLLQDLREAVFIYRQHKITVTASIGIASSNEVTDEVTRIDTLMRIADKRLYQAKDKQRDCVVVE